MTAKERKIQDELVNWLDTLERITKLENQIRAMEISITPSYALAGSSGSGGRSNKIEDYYIRKEEKERELQKLKRIISEIDRAITTGQFTDTERDIFECLIFGESLKNYARKRNIYKSYIYKLKDRAIRKIAKSVSNNTF